MKEKYGVAIAEVLDILNHTDKESVNKIAQSFIEFLKDNVDNNYKVNIDYSKPLEEAMLNEKTLSIIAMISYSYWCNEEEKRELLEKLKQNDIRYEKEIREKYNTDNLFKKDKNEENINREEVENKLIVIEKESFLSKFINKIKKFLKREE